MSLVSVPFFKNLGVSWGNTLLGCLSVLFLPTPLVSATRCEVDALTRQFFNFTDMVLGYALAVLEHCMTVQESMTVMTAVGEAHTARTFDHHHPPELSNTDSCRTGGTKKSGK
jgi:hypothetical protein